MSDVHVRRYLVSYDIPDDARRTRVARTLQAHGERIQFSVFVVDAKPARFARLRASLVHLLQEDVDSLLLCDLSGAELQVLGRAVASIDADTRIY